MNRRAKRNKYKRLCRQAEEAKQKWERYISLHKIAEDTSSRRDHIVKMSSMVPINRFEESLIKVDHEELDKHRLKLVAQTFVENLLSDPNFIEKTESDIGIRYDLDVVKHGAKNDCTNYR